MSRGAAVNIEKLLQAPLLVTWVVTARCNLHCPYCLEDAGAADGEDDSSEHVRELIVGELIANGVLKVYISGGEPFLVGSLPEHVSRLRKSGIAVRLTTNGTLVDETVADRLAASRVTMVDVSLHPGTTDAVRRAVALLVDRGVRTTLRVVITRSNLGSIEDILSPFVRSGVEKIGLQEVAPLGRAVANIAACGLSAEALRDVRRRIGEMRETTGCDFIGFASATLAEAESGRPTKCSMGMKHRRSCEIRPDGNVIPCTPAAVYEVSNRITDKGLSRCWRDLPGLYGRLAEAPLGGRCETCTRTAEGCSGGCRAVSTLATGQVSGGNPYCPFHEPLRAYDYNESPS